MEGWGQEVKVTDTHVTDGDKFAAKLAEVGAGALLGTGAVVVDCELRSEKVGPKSSQDTPINHRPSICQPTCIKQLRCVI